MSCILYVSVVVVWAANGLITAWMFSQEIGELLKGIVTHCYTLFHVLDNVIIINNCICPFKQNGRWSVVGSATVPAVATKDKLEHKVCNSVGVRCVCVYFGNYIVREAHFLGTNVSLLTTDWVHLVIAVFVPQTTSRPRKSNVLPSVSNNISRFIIEFCQKLRVTKFLNLFGGQFGVKNHDDDDLDRLEGSLVGAVKSVTVSRLKLVYLLWQTMKHDGDVCLVRWSLKCVCKYIHQRGWMKPLTGSARCTGRNWHILIPSIVSWLRRLRGSYPK